MQSWSLTEVTEAYKQLHSNPANIKWMKNPPDEVIRYAVQTDWKVAKFVRYLPQHIQEYVAEKAGKHVFSYIRNVSDETKEYACILNGMILEKIKNPSMQMILAALKNNGSAIQYVKEQTEEMQIMAIMTTPSSFQFFTRPSERVRGMALRISPENISYIRNPTPKDQVQAVTSDPNIIRQIRCRPCDEAIAIAVRGNPKNYNAITHPPEIASIELVKQGPLYITWVKNPSARVKWAAIMAHPSSIKYIPNATESMKVTAIFCS